MRRMSLLAVAVLGLLLAGCGKKAGEQAGEESPAQPTQPKAADKGTLRIEPEMLRDLKVTTAKVESRPGGEGTMLLGELRVNENAYAEIGTPTAARVVSLHVGSAEPVRSGQALATLQSTEVGKARSELITASARAELGRTVVERKRRLASERIVSERELQEAEANYASAQAEVRAARAALRALGGTDEASDSSQFVLRSPVSGMVLERNAMRGEMADPSKVLFRVGDLSTLWLTVQAFERDAIRIKRGSPVRISFAALPGQTFPGKVALVGRQVSPDSRTVPVRIEVNNRDGVLRPGMSATAWITPGGESEILTIPTAAMQRVEEDWVVFVPKASDTFEIRRVGRGRDLGGEIEVLSGVKAGETVVVDGSFLLKAEAEKAHGEGEHHEHD